MRREREKIYRKKKERSKDLERERERLEETRQTEQYIINSIQHVLEIAGPTSQNPNSKLAIIIPILKAFKFMRRLTKKVLKPTK